MTYITKKIASIGRINLKTFLDFFRIRSLDFDLMTFTLSNKQKIQIAPGVFLSKSYIKKIPTNCKELLWSRLTISLKLFYAKTENKLLIPTQNFIYNNVVFPIITQVRTFRPIKEFNEWFTIETTHSLILRLFILTKVISRAVYKSS